MSSYSGTIYYYAVLETDGSFAVKDNKKDCGCGGVKRPYLQWLDFNGTKGNDVTDFTTFTSGTKELNGLVLDIEVKCKTAELICSDERPLDFENDAMSMNMAYAVRYKAAARLYSDLLSTTEINRYTLMNREEIVRWIDVWNAEYNKWIDYMCNTLNISNNDCLVCRDKNGLIKNNIRV
jgi:hypothetical protein